MRAIGSFQVRMGGSRSATAWRDHLMTLLFLHDRTSFPGGVKPTYLARHGYVVVNARLPDPDFEAAVRFAQSEFVRYRPGVVIGSGRAGAVAMNIESGEARLVLLAPAWKTWGTARVVKAGTTILHSRRDPVVPLSDSEELIRDSGLAPSCLIAGGRDHHLSDPESLTLLLAACQA